MAQEPFAEQVIGTIAGAARMAAAGGGDVARLTSPPEDWLDAWDPHYIRTTLPALRAMSRIYFRGEVRGLDNIPAEGPVLLVGNHSGGTLIADTFVFAQAFYDHFGPDCGGSTSSRTTWSSSCRACARACRATARCRRRRRTWSGRSSAARRCSSTRAATTRPTGPRGSRPTSTSPGATGFARLAHRARRADRAGGGDRRAGDRAVPRPGPEDLQAAAARTACSG